VWRKKRGRKTALFPMEGGRKSGFAMTLHRVDGLFYESCSYDQSNGRRLYLKKHPEGCEG